MKLYVFYMIRNVKKELIDTPIMYAITDDSDYAKAFERTRNMKYFYKKEIECSRKEAMKEMDRARAPILTLTTLKTQKSNMITKVSLVCTWEEESRVLLDAPSIYFNHVSKNMINPDVFSDKVKMYLDRLVSFEINSKFQQMVLAFIVHNVPDTDETKDILKIFRLFDSNDDGRLTKDELYNGLVKYENQKFIKEKIDDIFLILDGANNGYIEYEEFLRACMEKKNLLCDEHLVYAFNFFDKDNTGRISVDKIKANFIDSNVSEEVFRSIFNEIDTNHDGEIDFGEFKDMMFGV